MREHDAAGAAGRVALGFGDAIELDVLESTVEEVADRLHIAYRVRVREDGELLLVEHQALAKVADSRITHLSLVCSGFRPLQAGSRDEGKVDGAASGVLRSEG